jgi:hypothetical protein
LQLVQSVENQVSLQDEPSLYEGLAEGYANLHTVMRRLERKVANEIVKVVPKCTYEGKSLDIYTCSDLSCSVHGERNRILASDS